MFKKDDLKVECKKAGIADIAKASEFNRSGVEVSAQTELAELNLDREKLARFDREEKMFSKEGIFFFLRRWLNSYIGQAHDVYSALHEKASSGYGKRSCAVLL